MKKYSLSNNAQKAVGLVRNRISSINGGFDGRAVLLFSGGRDSNLVASAFCQAFPKSELHLLLIDNGLLSRLDSTERQVVLLEGLFPETDIIFFTKRVSQMMRQVGMQQVESDFIEKKFSTLLICLACKLIMNFSAARYARELGIKLVIDGYADRQRNFPEQTQEFIDFVSRLYKELELIHLSPLYDFLTEKELVNQTLDDLGVYIHKQEPICMWSDSFSIAKPAEVVQYLEKTVNLIRQFDPILRC